MASRTGTTLNLGNYLSKKHALIAFEIQAQAQTPSAKDMSDERFKQEVLKIQDQVGFELVESARKTMSKWLDPSNPRRIGLTGKASQNLFTRKVNAPGIYGQKTQVVWYVYEGNLTKANRFIRQGTRPNKSKHLRALQNSQRARSEGWKALQKAGVKSHGATYIEGPLIARLSEWARARGLKPRIKPPRLLRERMRTPERGIGPGPATQVNLAMENYKRWRSMVWALYHAILKHGTSQDYKKRFGSPYFDYVKVYVSGQGGNNSGTARQIARAKLARQGEAYRNLSEISARFVYSKFYKSGAVRGKWTSNILGS